MKAVSRIVLLAVAFLVGASAGPSRAALRGAAPWPVIPPEETREDVPVVDSRAGAEVLLWERRVEDGRGSFGGFKTIVSQHLRTKVRSESAVEGQSTLVIPFGDGVRVEEVSGRTVLPDGTVVPVDAAAIFQQTLAQAGDVRLRTVRIAFPAVRAGAIVEARWSEVHDDHVTMYEEVELQRSLPIRRLVYSIKPLRGSSFGMRSRAFRIAPAPFVKGPGGFYTTEMKDIPAFRPEPWSPPLAAVRGWMLIYYTGEDEDDADGFWKRVGRSVHAAVDERLEPDRSTRALAREAIGDEERPGEKLRRLHELLRARVRDSSSPGFPEREREKARGRAVKAQKVIERGFGEPEEIDVAFASLARAVGFDARLAFYADRRRFLFHPGLANGYFLRSSCVAVRVDGAWRFFDPGNRFLPWGTLRWGAENALALVPDKDEPEFARMPAAGTDANVERTRLRLRLAEDGSASGDLEIELRGQRAVDERAEIEGLDDEARRERLRKALSTTLAGVEVSEYTIQSPVPAADPVTFRAKLAVPSLATKAGSRLLVAPSVLRRGRSPDPPVSERTNPVFLGYAWTEEDEVTIQLPAGWALEETPGPVRVPSGDFGSLVAVVESAADGSGFVLRRTARTRSGFFPVERYGSFRAFRETIREADDRVVALRRSGTR